MGNEAILIFLCSFMTEYLEYLNVIYYVILLNCCYHKKEPSEDLVYTLEMDKKNTKKNNDSWRSEISFAKVFCVHSFFPNLSSSHSLISLS